MSSNSQVLVNTHWTVQVFSVHDTLEAEASN
jgi:hypothetical protein